MICHIIDNRILRRIPPHAPRNLSQHVLIPPQELSRPLKKPVIIFCQSAICRYVIRIVDILKRKAFAHDFDSGQFRVLRQIDNRRTLTVHMHPVNMIFCHPVTDTVPNQVRTGPIRKIKLQNQFDSIPVQFSHQFLQFPYRIPGRTVGSFGRKITALCVAPVIKLRFGMLLLLILVQDKDLLKFIQRHKK